MNAKDKILVLGIVLTFLGIYSLAEDVFFLVLTWSENTNDFAQTHSTFQLYVLTYLSIPIHIAYFIAGILYLLRRKKTQKFVQWTIVSSIIYESFVFNFFGVIIDLLLLYFIFRLSKYYDKSNEEIAEIESKENKKTISENKSKRLSVLSVFLLLPPLLIMIMWFIASGLGGDFQETKELYLSWFPEFLRGYGTLSYISILLSIGAVISSAIAFRHDLKGWAVLNRIVVILGCLLLFMNLWSLM